MALYEDQPRTYDAAVLVLVPRARVYFYEVGTTDNKPAYSQCHVHAPLTQGAASTFTFSVPHPNPMRSDEAARLPAIFLDGEYRILIEDENGDTLHDLDPFTAWPMPDPIAPLSDDGDALPFCVLTFYRSKTTMLEDLSGDNPITADEFGVFPSVTLTDGVAYRAILRDREGRLIYDVDPIVTPAPEIDTLAIRKLAGLAGIINMVAPAGEEGFTFCGWARLQQNAGYIWTIKANDSSNTLYMALVVDGLGIELNISSDDTPTFGLPDNDRWFFWAVTIYELAGNTVAAGRWCYLEDVAFSPANELLDQLYSTDPLSTLEIQIDQLGNSQISGSDGSELDFTQTRQWTAVLSEAELLLEKDSISAVRTADLFSDNTMQGVTDLADASGNGNTISLSNSDNFETTDGPDND